MGFGPPVTPQIIKNLMIANGVVFALQLVDDRVTQFGVVIPAAVWQGFEIWRPFTYMWLHGGPMHILFNMFALWMFGSQLVMTWGEQRFLKYYLVCGVGAGFVIATLPYLLMAIGIADTPFSRTLGASGAVMGVLLAFSFTWPDRTIMLIFPPMPIKAIWLIPLIFFIELASSGHGSNISHAGHLGGVLVGWYYLVAEGRTPGAPTLESLKHRYHRYRMRQKIRAVHEENRREQRKRWEEDDDSRRYH